MGIRVGIREYARSRRSRGLPGGTHQAVRNHIARGHLVLGGDGLLDADEADLAWARHSDDSSRRNLEQEAHLPVGRAVAPAPPAQPEPAWIARPEPLPAPPAAAVAGPALAVALGREVVARRVASPAAPTSSPELVAAERTRGTVSEASAELKRHQAAIAKLKLDELAGALVRAEEVDREWQGLIITARNQLLGVPAAFRTRCPHIAPEDIRTLEGMIRQVLQDLADAGGGEAAEGAA